MKKYILTAAAAALLMLPSGAEAAKLPGEAMRMAMCVLTVAPMLLVFPRFQKYFVKGMAIGSVKE